MVPPVLIIMVDPMFSYSMISGRNIRAEPLLFNMGINSPISVKLDALLKLSARSSISVRGLSKQSFCRTY